MTFHFYFAWLLTGLIASFFYRRLHKTPRWLLAPLYFGLFVLFGGLFLIGMCIVFYEKVLI